MLMSICTVCNKHLHGFLCSCIFLTDCDGRNTTVVLIFNTDGTMDSDMFRFARKLYSRSNALYSLSISERKETSDNDTYLSWYLINSRPVHPYREEFSMLKRETINVYVKDDDSLEADQLSWLDNKTYLDVFVIESEDDQDVSFLRALFGSNLVHHTYYMRVYPGQREEVVIKENQKESQVLLKTPRTLANLGPNILQGVCPGG